jgi:2-C-methyl-D-erythritol 2,4-cyclodiphosphate synthase
MRVGLGFDAHRFGAAPPTLLAGVVVDTDRGVEATSDGDVVAHAVADAILGGSALGDLGGLFPSGDERWHDADSMEMLAEVVARAAAAGFRVGSVDLTVITERIRVEPHREMMRGRLAEVLGVGPAAVSVKATTTDGLGFLGRDEGIAVLAAVVLVED